MKKKISQSTNMNPPHAYVITCMIHILYQLFKKRQARLGYNFAWFLHCSPA